MARCSGFWEGLLKVLNFAVGTLGLIMLGCGLYLLRQLNESPGPGPDEDEDNIPELFLVGRTVLVELIGLSNNFVNMLPRTWFVYLLTGVGGALFVISLFGYIGAVTKSRLCLSFYIILVVVLILIQLIGTAFILLDPHWTDVIQADKTGYLHEVYSFLKHNWKAIKWVALAVVILEASAFLVAFIVRALNAPPDEFESDLECDSPRGSNHQPLIHNQQTESSGDQENSFDQKPVHSDSWSQRMRDKYGLDTSKFTYNPTAATTSDEQRRRCNIV